MDVQNQYSLPIADYCDFQLFSHFPLLSFRGVIAATVQRRVSNMSILERILLDKMVLFYYVSEYYVR